MSLFTKSKKNMQKSKMQANRKQQRKSGWKLESLEPRLLLSGDGLLASQFQLDQLPQVNTNVSANPWALEGATNFQGSYYAENNVNHMIRVDMRDAAGAAGTGWDILFVDGNLNVSADREQRYTVRLRVQALEILRLTLIKISLIGGKFWRPPAL